MKILFFINHLAGGGAERVAAALLNHLCIQNDVTACFFCDKEPSFPINDKIAIQKIITIRNSKIIRAIIRTNKIRKLIKTNNPDLIISFLTYTNIYVLIANVFQRKKIIVSEHNTLKRIQSKGIRIIRRLIYQTADRITFVTKADCLKFGLPQKSVTIYNPALFNIFSDYSNRHKSIITIASYNRWYNKGLDLLIKAWNKIATHNPNWNLEIYGDMQNEPLPDILAKQEMVKVTINDWCDNIIEVLKEKGIFVLASRFEGCPCSLIEAMSQGCVCLVTDCDGGQKEIINDGVNGLIAKCGDIDDIAAKLQLLINDANLRSQLSANAIETVKHFDKNTYFAEWDTMIENVTQR